MELAPEYSIINLSFIYTNENLCMIEDRLFGFRRVYSTTVKRSIESMSSLLVRSGFYLHSMGVIRFQNSFSPKARELEASSPTLPPLQWSVFLTFSAYISRLFIYIIISAFFQPLAFVLSLFRSIRYMYIMIIINTDRSGVRYQSSGAQIRNQISVYNICTA